jgi:type IV pilus assembly protein PilB
MLWELELTPEEVRGRTFYFGKGCELCNNTGYKGRTGLFEIMRIDDQLCDLILQHASTNVIREEARKRGMRTLRDSGLLSIYDGVTTIEEVIRATVTDQ